VYLRGHVDIFVWEDELHIGDGDGTKTFDNDIAPQKCWIGVMEQRILSKFASLLRSCLHEQINKNGDVNIEREWK
jgi:hypothetical protein